MITKRTGEETVSVRTKNADNKEYLSQQGVFVAVKKPKDPSKFGVNGYYNVISRKEFSIVPGVVSEQKIVLNNSTGDRRQVLYVIESDPSNPDISIVPAR